MISWTNFAVVIWLFEFVLSSCLFSPPPPSKQCRQWCNLITSCLKTNFGLICFRLWYFIASLAVRPSPLPLQDESLYHFLSEHPFRLTLLLGFDTFLLAFLLLSPCIVHSRHHWVSCLCFLILVVLVVVLAAVPLLDCVAVVVGVVAETKSN